MNAHNNIISLASAHLHSPSRHILRPCSTRFWRDMYASSHAVNLLAQARVLLPSNGNPAYSETDKNHTFRWTTGNNPALSHCKVIGRGGAGEVHEVSSLCIHRWLIRLFSYMTETAARYVLLSLIFLKLWYRFLREKRFAHFNISLWMTCRTNYVPWRNCANRDYRRISWQY